MSKEKFKPEIFEAYEAYCDNGALSHWEFVNDEGEKIGIFCDEEAHTLERMERQEHYAHIFAAAPEMLDELLRSDDLLRDALKFLPVNSGLYREIEKQLEENKKALKKARG